MEHFFPKFRWTPKKKKKKKKKRSAHVDYTQTIGGHLVKLLGGIYLPSPPGFGTSVCI